MGSFDRIKNKKTFKMLEFNQCQKFNKAPFRIYVDLECLIENIYGCKDNTENSHTRKVGDHISSSFWNFEHFLNRLCPYFRFLK